MNGHIEFLGLPGSGKSTIYSAITTQSMIGSHSILSLKEALWFSLRKGISDSLWKPIISLLPSRLGTKMSSAIFVRTKDYGHAFSLFCAENQETISALFQAPPGKYGQEKAYYWLTELFSQFQFIKNNLPRDEHLILDEGFTQKAISLFAYPDLVNSQLLEEYALHHPKPALVYLVEGINHDTRRRGKVGMPLRMKKLSTDERAGIYERCRQVIEHIVPILKKRGVRVIRIDNKGEIEATLRQIHFYNLEQL